MPPPPPASCLSDILLRLPPQPSSLPRASLVCKRWRRLVVDPHFHRRFRARHRNPPLIGFFEDFVGNTFFRPVMDPPDLIPTERFRPPLGGKSGCDSNKWRIFGCRHGHVLLYNRKQKEIVLWDPPTGDHRQVAVPPEYDNEARMIWNGAVLCAAAGDRSHVHGSFSSCPSRWHWLASPATTHKYLPAFTRPKQANGAILSQQLFRLWFIPFVILVPWLAIPCTGYLLVLGMALLSLIWTDID